MNPKPEKPYRFDTIKKPVTPTDFAMWESTLWDYLKAIKRYKPLLKKNLTWTTDEQNNRGFTDDADGEEANRLTAEDKSEIIESILLNIGTYRPKSIFIDVLKSVVKSLTEKLCFNCGYGKMERKYSFVLVLHLWQKE